MSMEEQLRKLWGDVLEIEFDEEDPSFFELGGDSVAATQLVDKARAAGIDIPDEAVFEYPELKAMAQHCKPLSTESLDTVDSVAQNGLIKYGPGVIKVAAFTCKTPAENIEDIGPCADMQKKMVVAHTKFGAAGSRIPFVLIRPDGSEPSEEDIQKLQRSWSALVEKHPTLRTRVIQHPEHGLMQVILKNDTAEWREEESMKAALSPDKTRLNVGQRLTSEVIVRQGGKVFVVITIHHAISDRATKRMLYDDLQLCLNDPEAFAAAKPRSSFIPYARYVSQQSVVDGAKFWLPRLAQLPTPQFEHLSAPSPDRGNGNVPHRSHTRTFTNPKFSTARLPVSFQAIARGAWALAVARRDGTLDTLTLVLGSGRGPRINGVDVNNMLGCAAVSSPLRVKINPNESVETFLRRVQTEIAVTTPWEQFGNAMVWKALGCEMRPQLMILNPTQTGLWIQDHNNDIFERPELRYQGSSGLVILKPRGDLYKEPLLPVPMGHIVEKMGDEIKVIINSSPQSVSDEEVVEISKDWENIMDKILSGAKTVNQLYSKDGALSNGAAVATNGASALVHKSDTLGSLFTSDAVNAEAPAFIIPDEQDGTTFSYGRFTSVVSNLQERLAALGVKEGTPVSIALPNGIELVATFLATTWQRGIAAPLNPAYKTDEFEFYIEDLQSGAIIIPKDTYAKDGPAVQAARKFGATIIECHAAGDDIALDVKEEGARLSSAGAQPLLSAEPSDVALVLHTSGTTGRPKAVPLTHLNLMTTTANVSETYRLTPEDRTMLIMPLFHVHGLLASFLSPLRAGGAAIVPDRLKPTFWADYVKYRATWYTATPTMHTLLLKYALPGGEVPYIRFIRSCSSPLSAQLFKALEEKFHAPVLEAYAMTEASHQMFSNPLPPDAHKVGSVGKPTGVEVKLLDDADNEVPAGTAGQIAIRGPNVTKGYLNNEAANASSFTADGFFKTGDQGRFDGDGFLSLTGRLKEFINKGGEKISPIEIDEMVAQHEAVAECVAFGFDDETFGQDVGVAIKLKEGQQLDAKGLRGWALKRISNLKVPKKIYIVDQIPKTATGKVQRKAVAEAMSKVDPAA